MACRVSLSFRFAEQGKRWACITKEAKSRALLRDSCASTNQAPTPLKWQSFPSSNLIQTSWLREALRIVTNCPHLANCDLQTIVITPQHHLRQPSSNKSHTNQTWCVRVFLQTHMAICTHMTTYEKIEYWHGTANSSWTMLLMHKQSNVQQMITDCDLTRGLEHWVSFFAPRDAAKQQLLWLTLPSKQTKLSQCVEPKTLSSIIPWATRSTQMA